MDPPPQRRLPGLFFGQLRPDATAGKKPIPPGLPGGEPVGPVHLVLIKKSGEMYGQLMAFPGIFIIGKKSCEHGKNRVIPQLG